MVAERRQSINLRHGGGHTTRIGFEADEIVDAAKSQTVQIAGNARQVVVEQWGNVNDFGQLLADQFGNKRFSANTGTLLAKFDVAPHEVSDQGALIEVIFVITRLCTPTHAD